MSVIGSLCDAIVGHLSRLGITTADDLLPGASEERLRELTARLPFPLPPSVVELYQWSEGVPVAHGTCSEFFPGYGLDCAEYMVKTYHDLSNAPEFPRFRCGDMQWVPIFRSGGTDFYAVCCRGVGADQVVDDDNEGTHRDCVTPPPVKYASLEAMLKTLLAAYESGVFYVEDDSVTYGVTTYFEDGPHKGCLKGVDISDFKAIARQFNPGIESWE